MQGVGLGAVVWLCLACSVMAQAPAGSADTGAAAQAPPANVTPPGPAQPSTGEAVTQEAAPQQSETQQAGPEQAGDPPPPPDPVLYAYSGPEQGEVEGILIDGARGHIATFQHALNVALLGCDAGIGIDPDGMFGPRTRQAIRRLAECEGIAARLPENSAARDGAITQALWSLLVPMQPPPGPRARARALLLSFEGTDITEPARWNFCQNNRETYDPRAEDPTCLTNDRWSYLTWGPNGATAGHGREILAILARVERFDADLIDRAFATEADAVRRMFDLSLPLGDDSELRRYLCGVYADPERREYWAQGFADLGRSPEVRSIYRRLYDSASFDGGKIRTFLEAWRHAGLEPTEVDFAFFSDRAAHTAVRNVEIRRILRRIMARGGAEMTPAQIRRAFARQALVSNRSQRGPRMGRDVTYYIDALDDSLTRAERLNWERVGARRASAVGLSDARPAPDLRVGPPDRWRARGTRPLTEAEASSCPAPILNPRAPRRGS